jgi:hypothetical protein
LAPAAGGVRAQVAEHGPVRIHVGDDVKGRLPAQRAPGRVGLVEQARQQPLDEPLGHRLAGMLASDDPDRPRALAHHQIGDLQAAGRGAGLGSAHLAAKGIGLGDVCGVVDALVGGHGKQGGIGIFGVELQAAADRWGGAGRKR